MTAGLHTIHSKHSFQLLPARCQSWTCHTSALTKDRQTILIQIDHEESILKQKVSRVKTDKRFKRTLIYHEESILKQESVRSKHIKDSKECLFIYHEESILKQSVSQVKTHKRFKRTLIYYDRNNTMHIFREIPLKSGQNCQCILHYNPCLCCLNLNTNGWELWKEKWETFCLSTWIKNLPKGSTELWPQNRNCSVTHISLYAGSHPDITVPVDWV